MHITHTLSQNNQVREIPSVCFLNLPFECHLLILSQQTRLFFFFFLLQAVLYSAFKPHIALRHTEIGD